MHYYDLLMGNIFVTYISTTTEIAITVNPNFDRVSLNQGLALTVLVMKLTKEEICAKPSGAPVAHLVAPNEVMPRMVYLK